MRSVGYTDSVAYENWISERVIVLATEIKSIPKWNASSQS